MKLSELMNKLQTTLIKYGDIDVFVETDLGDIIELYNTQVIQVKKDDKFICQQLLVLTEISETDEE